MVFSFFFKYFICCAMVSYHFLSGEHGKKMIKIGVPCKKMLNFGAD